MKVSEITTENIITHLRLTEVDDSLDEELSTFLEVAINYIENYTGIKRKSEENKEQENLDTYSDFVIVVYILCQDMIYKKIYYI